MNNTIISPDERESLKSTRLKRAMTYLRQAETAFEQQRRQQSWWNFVTLIMAGLAIVLVVAVMVISCYILLKSAQYSETVVKLAAGALFTDILGLFIGVWKMVLNRTLVTQLHPVIEDPYPETSQENPDE